VHCVSIGDVFFVDVPAILRFSLILLFIRLRNVFGQLEGSLEVIGVICTTSVLLSFGFFGQRQLSVGTETY